MVGSTIAPAASHTHNALAGSAQDARFALAAFQGELLNALAVQPNPER